MLHEPEHDRRHQREDGGPVLLHQGEELHHVEARHDQDGAAARQAQHHDHDHAVDVEERQHRHRDVVLAEAVEVLHALALAQVRDQVAMGQHHALGQAGGPARVGQRDQVVGGIDRHRRRGIARLHQLGERPRPRRVADHEDLLHLALGRRLPRLVQEGRHRDQEARPRVVELVGQLVGGVERVHRRVHPARHRDPKEHHRVFREVGAIDGHDLALAEAAPGQAGRGAPRAFRDLPVGERAPGRPVDEGGLVAQAAGVAQHEVGDGDVGDGDGGARGDHGGSSLAARPRAVKHPRGPARSPAAAGRPAW